MSNEVKILSGIGIFTVLLIGIAAFTFGGSSTPNKNIAGTKIVDQSLLVREDSHKIATSTAKVTLVEFADFECPACAQAQPIVKQLVEEYKGKMNFVYRQYPLPSHKNAQAAAMAAEAAGAQGKFFEMYDKIYTNQTSWSGANNPSQYFEKYAQELKLDEEKFKKDSKDKKLEGRILRDQSDGNAAGVSATPTFYLNGRQIVGALDYEAFKKEIETALANAK